MSGKRNWFKNIGLFFDRSFSKGIVKQIIWLIGIMLLVYAILVCISYCGWFYTSENGLGRGRWYDILYVLIAPGLVSKAMTSPFFVICALIGLIVFSGMLISVISNVLERRVESYAKGKANYKVKNHVVILGYNTSVPSLLNKIYRKDGDRYVLLMSERDTEEIRNWIGSHVKPEIVECLIVMRGVRTADDDLARLRLDRGVKEIYVLGEENETDHDNKSLECVKKLSMMLPQGTTDCHVQIDSYTMFSVLQSVDFGDTMTEGNTSIKQHLSFHPFNFNEIWAQKALATIPKKVVVDGNAAFQYFPLDSSGITADSSKHVHLILLGMNDMSTSLAVNAAHILHFPNFKEGDFSTYSQITFIDPEADSNGSEWRNRYRHLFSLSRWRSVSANDATDPSKGWIDPIGDEVSVYRHLGSNNFMDIQWEFIKGDLYDGSVQDYLMACAQDEGALTTIAICMDDSEKNAAFCLALSEEICKNVNTILVRQKETPVTIDLIRKMPPNHDRIRAFGMMNECYDENLASDRYGKIINACYSGIDIDGLLLPDQYETVAKEIDEKWAECSILDKWSSNYCANMLFTKLRSMGLSDEADITPQAIEDRVNQSSVQDDIQRTEHNRWNIEKLILGFAPLTLEEQQAFVSLKDDKAELKKKKKAWSAEHKKHLDLCSNETLCEIDPYAVGFDTMVNSKLWVLYQMAKEV